MPKLLQISGKDLVKALMRDGWIQASQRGSHVKMIKKFQIGKSTLIVPQHKIIKKGTLSAILKDAGMSVEKLKELL